MYAVWWCYDYYTNSGSYKKHNNWQSSVLLLYVGQKRLNGAADWSAAKDGHILPYFKHIVGGALTPPCPITAVF
jgi:hypothetical protein